MSDMITTLAFDQSDLAARLPSLSADELDSLDFGVIGFDAATAVRVYNSFESRCAGLSLARVLGQPLFTSVAPCMNNFMVGQRFEDARSSGVALDDTIDYVLTLRMRPVKVKLRLLLQPGQELGYVLVRRPT